MEKEIEEVLQKYPDLVYDAKDHFLKGTLLLPCQDSYEVLIDLKSYPRFFPTVFEVGSRIPKKAQRHIYGDTGSCCFTTRAQSQILLKTKINSLLQFIDEIVVRYFENNSYYEINDRYYGEEYSHNIRGILEGYQDILRIKETKLIFKVMAQRIRNQKLRPNDLCYCGSKRKMKQCHQDEYRNFRKIERKVVKEDFHYLHR
ncbi:MAG: hypothetical protein WBA61_04160 [Aequorivita sp.]